MNAFRIMDARWREYEWVLALLALFMIWRKWGYVSPHRRTRAHSIARERHRVVKAHGRRKGDWVSASTTAGWALTAVARGEA